MELENYSIPNQNCLHPIVVKSNGARILVPCGKCALCRLNRTNVLRQLCNLESLAHGYQYFITLTYSEEYVPRFFYSREVTREAWNKGFNASFELRRRKPFGTDFSDQDDDAFFYALTDVSELDTIRARQQEYIDGEYINCLYRPDTQRFIKRLNGILKRFFKNEKFKMRYFLVGEYGPKHLRPHYHMLLWFDSSVDLADLDENIRKAWPFGRTDCQVSRGGCGNYTSGYVNSYACVPGLFAKCRPFSGFQSRSNGLGRDWLVSQKDQIYGFERVTPAEIDARILRFWKKSEANPVHYASKFSSPVYPVNGESVPVFFYRYAKDWFFPRTLRYNLSDRSIIKEDYLLYVRATEFYPNTDSLADMTRRIIADIIQCYSSIQGIREGELCNTYYDNRIYMEFLANMSTYLPDSSYFRERVGLYRFKHYLRSIHFVQSKYTLCQNERNIYDQLYSRIYMALHISRHFVDDILEGSLSDADRYIDIITSYYAQAEADYWDNLKSLADISNGIFEDDFLKHAFPDSYNESEYMQTAGYKYLKARTAKNVENRIKHKKMNDINRDFLN